MATDIPTTIPGIVQNGVVVPQSDATLREGTHVEIVIEPSVIPPELLAEITAWDKASDESWAMIDQWESEPSLGENQYFIGHTLLSSSSESITSVGW